MRNAGVKILFLEQMPANYAASVMKALTQQDFHPALVLGPSTYSENLVPDSGGPRPSTVRTWSRTPPLPR